MKRKFFIVIPIILTLLLSSCISKKTNYFIVGSFTAYTEETAYVLNISNISYDEYQSANGVNVVEDYVLKSKKRDNYYFKIELYKKTNDENILLNFYNLKDSLPGYIDQPMQYTDDYGNDIIPCTRDNDIWPPYYCVEYQREYIYFETTNYV